MPLLPRPKGKTIQDLAGIAITALKSKQGSSVPAITKYLNATFDMGGNAKLSSLLLKALNAGVKSGRFEKVRASFKVSRQWLQSEKAKEKQKLKKAAKQKREAEAAREKKQKQKLKEKAKAKAKQKKTKSRSNGSKKNSTPAVKLIDDTKLLAMEKKRKKSQFLELPAAYEIEGYGDDARYLGDFLFVLGTCVTFWDHTEQQAFFRLCDLQAAIGDAGINPLLTQIHVKLLQYILSHIHDDDDDSDDDSDDSSDDDDEQRELDRRRRRKEKQAALIAAAAAPDGAAATDAVVEDDSPFATWWLDALDETTWPSVLFHYVNVRANLLREQAQRDLWSPSVKVATAARNIEQHIPELLPVNVVSRLHSTGYASLSVPERLELLTYLCHEVLIEEEFSDHFFETAHNFIEVVNELKVEEREQREAEKERRAALREKEARERAKRKKSKQPRQSNEEILEEIVEELEEIESGANDYDGDPNDRKALLQHGQRLRAQRKALLERKQRLEHAIAVEARKKDKEKNAAAIEELRRSKILTEARGKVRVLPVGVDRFNRNYWFLGSVAVNQRDALATEGVLIQAHLFLEDTETGEWGSFQEEEQLDELLESLNPRGIRESQLLSNLQILKPIIMEGITSAEYTLAQACNPPKSAKKKKSSARNNATDNSEKKASGHKTQVAGYVKVCDSIADPDYLLEGDKVSVFYSGDQQWYIAQIVKLPPRLLRERSADDDDGSDDGSDDGEGENTAADNHWLISYNDDLSESLDLRQENLRIEMLVIPCAPSGDIDDACRNCEKMLVSGGYFGIDGRRDPPDAPPSGTPVRKRIEHQRFVEGRVVSDQEQRRRENIEDARRSRMKAYRDSISDHIAKVVEATTIAIDPALHARLLPPAQEESGEKIAEEDAPASVLQAIKAAAETAPADAEVDLTVTDGNDESSEETPHAATATRLASTWRARIQECNHAYELAQAAFEVEVVFACLVREFHFAPQLEEQQDSIVVATNDVPDADPEMEGQTVVPSSVGENATAVETEATESVIKPSTPDVEQQKSPAVETVEVDNTAEPEASPSEDSSTPNVRRRSSRTRSARKIDYNVNAAASNSANPRKRKAAEVQPTHGEPAEASSADSSAPQDAPTLLDVADIAEDGQEVVFLWGGHLSRRQEWHAALSEAATASRKASSKDEDADSATTTPRRKRSKSRGWSSHSKAKRKNKKPAVATRSPEDIEEAATLAVAFHWRNLIHALSNIVWAVHGDDESEESESEESEDSESEDSDSDEDEVEDVHTDADGAHHNEVDNSSANGAAVVDAPNEKQPSLKAKDPITQMQQAHADMERGEAVKLEAAGKSESEKKLEAEKAERKRKLEAERAARKMKLDAEKAERRKKEQAEKAERRKKMKAERAAQRAKEKAEKAERRRQEAIVRDAELQRALKLAREEMALARAQGPTQQSPEGLVTSQEERSAATSAGPSNTPASTVQANAAPSVDVAAAAVDDAPKPQ